MGNICQHDTTAKPEIYDLTEPSPHPKSFEKLRKLEITDAQELENFLENQKTCAEIKDDGMNSTESLENSKHKNYSQNNYQSTENQNISISNQQNSSHLSYQEIIINLSHRYISQQLMNQITKFLIQNHELVHLELNFSIYFDNNLNDQQVFEDLEYLPHLQYLDFNVQLNEGEYIHQNYFSNLEKILRNQKDLRILTLNLKECQLKEQQVELIFDALKQLKYLKNLHLIFDKNNITPLLKSEKFLAYKTFRGLNYLELSFKKLKEKLSKQDMHILGQKLQSFKEIKQVQIDLSKNGLNSDKLISFLQNLKKLEKIDNLSLNISQNDLNKSVISVFKQELKQCKSLQTVQLNVSQNPQIDVESSNQLLGDDMQERFQSIHVITESQKK